MADIKEKMLKFAGKVNKWRNKYPNTVDATEAVLILTALFALIILIINCFCIWPPLGILAVIGTIIGGAFIIDIMKL